MRPLSTEEINLGRRGVSPRRDRCSARVWLTTFPTSVSIPRRTEEGGWKFRSLRGDGGFRMTTTPATATRRTAADLGVRQRNADWKGWGAFSGGMREEKWLVARLGSVLGVKVVANFNVDVFVGLFAFISGRKKNYIRSRLIHLKYVENKNLILSRRIGRDIQSSCGELLI